MHITTDPNELAPLTELANRALQEPLRKIPEFATSSKWAASAIVLQMAEGPEGYQMQIGFELRTPLDEPLHDSITGITAIKEASVRRIVEEWLAHCLPPALAIHSASDANAKLGETLITAKNRVYSWRAAEGPPIIATEDKDAREQLQRELAAHSLFDRLNLAAILPIDREVPLLCLKLQIVQPAAGAPLAYECRLNHQTWPEGLAILRNFHLPKSKHPLRLTQYVFFRRSGKSRAPTTAPAAPVKASTTPATPISAQPSTKRPWWKVW